MYKSIVGVLAAAVLGGCAGRIEPTPSPVTVREFDVGFRGSLGFEAFHCDEGLHMTNDTSCTVTSGGVMWRDEPSSEYPGLWECSVKPNPNEQAVLHVRLVCEIDQ